MASAMYTYTKAVLAKVSFDPELFTKELQKAFNRLTPGEIDKLKAWVVGQAEKNPQLQECLSGVVEGR